MLVGTNRLFSDKLYLLEYVSIAFDVRIRITDGIVHFKVFLYIYPRCIEGYSWWANNTLLQRFSFSLIVNWLLLSGVFSFRKENANPIDHWLKQKWLTHGTCTLLVYPYRLIWDTKPGLVFKFDNYNLNFTPIRYLYK